MNYSNLFRLAKDLSLAFIYLVFLPNVLFYFIFSYLGISRAYVNLDYAVCVVVFLFGWRVLGAFLLGLSSVLEALSLVSQVVPFVRLQDLFYLLGFVDLAPFEYRVLLWLWPFLVFLFACLLLRFSTSLNRLASLLTLNFLIGLYVFDLLVVDGGESGDIFWRAEADNLVSSQLAFFYKSRTSFFVESFENDAAPVLPLKGDAASDKWRKDLSKGVLSPRLLLIVVESWGVPVNKDIQSEILRSIYDLKPEAMSAGKLAFEGVTIGGELRELCRLSPAHFNLKQGDVSFSSCLPNELLAHGYQGKALHGAAGLMYDRKDWYPLVGFEDSLFLEKLVPPRLCFSFPGACDIDLFRYVGEFFSSKGTRFFYWLTLNTHSMYDKRDIVIDVFDCEKYGLNLDFESCRNLKLQAQFFSGLASLLKQPEMEGVEILIVGDHKPKIFNHADFSAVFEDGVVPWVNFKVGGR